MNSNLHENDLYAWTRQQVQLLKSGQLSALDVSNLIDEVDDMGGSIRNQLESRLEVLLMHLLKWQYQPNYRGRSWQLTIKEQRRKIERLIRKNPSLQNTLDQTLADAYGDAILAAAKETGMAENIFPEQCPYSIQQIIYSDYLPD
ncbi:MAG: DUF29 domain-containing protein [Candidatus Methylumidiphilus alinenensis]|uniref:DUF29 domain-containing protein n=1 Tax=Candidatus Methylumidiphilus alinenensis TaxID=2202197 RepID=A0A2W4T4J3_9GAMM|nr:MAG: DUF29 domain-containing protein [Candidatus Methylumidiphilus alinenensis]